MTRLLCMLLVLSTVVPQPAHAEPARDILAARPARAGDLDAPRPAGTPRVAPHPGGSLASDAEKIVRLQRSLEADVKRLAELQANLSNLEEDYRRAEEEFTRLDTLLNDRRRDLQKLRDAGNQDETPGLSIVVDELEKKWGLSKERLELTIQERKVFQENVATLEQKLKQGRDALRELSEPRPGDVATTSPAAPAMAPAAAPEPAAAPTADTAAAASTASTATGSSQAGSLSALPHPALRALAPAGESTPSDGAATAKTERPPSKELLAAAEEAAKSKTAAEEAEQQARVLNQRIEVLKKNIQLERTLRDTTRRRVDNIDETLRDLNRELYRKIAAGANTDALREQISLWDQRQHEARGEARRISTYLDELQSDLVNLQAEQLHAMSDAEQKRHHAEAAEAKFIELQNPFTVRNILQWLAHHGPRLFVILAMMSSGLWLSRVFENRLVSLMATRGRRGTLEERENRAKTLVGVMRNAQTVLIIGGGIAMLMDEIGVPVGPLVGGAAVLGLALAFGAQSLIKDYFTGFMVLLEQQYLVNDVIKIGDIAGQVERITLRMTVLRDLEGRVHFVPHGQINSVTNMTHGWSRAVFAINVAYKEDVDHVIDVLMQLAQQLRNDPEFGPLIIEDPAMLGVDGFGDSSVVIKFLLKTRPLKQWVVKRELLRRIKVKFDEEGIEIPFPHRTIYHRTLPASDAADLRGEADDAQWSRKDVA